MKLWCVGDFFLQNYHIVSRGWEIHNSHSILHFVINNYIL